ncbi:uncharacterized protein LOC112166537 isoform X2 [Rosa chinensis]|uniref:uncharacterized protein LOC112166537 isoform X2 n=1 Tax=Rosa chinensis TaxID=74649 RepID=UPI000D088FED|nr:uncharacterized protein LOC112166537 isoform X2 [Rosa chinensis]
MVLLHEKRSHMLGECDKLGNWTQIGSSLMNLRASEYSALRASAVKMRGLFERLRSCVNAQGMTGFVESLRSLAQSLGKWSTLACFHWLRILRKHRSL